ncbi:MAG: BamA/TamA family outer membrane protein [Acidobacteriota bacterium]
MRGKHAVSFHDSGTHADLTGCTIAPAEMQQADQSRLFVQLTLKNGKPLVAPADAQLRLTEKFCANFRCNRSADGTLLPADNALLGRLLKRLNAALAALRFFDEEARVDLFPEEPLPAPVEPPADGPQEAIDDYNKAKKKKELSDALNSAINSLEMTATLRNRNGSFGPFFKQDGLFDQWRNAVLENQTVRKAFEEFWKANEEPDRAFTIKGTADTLRVSFLALISIEGASKLGRSALSLFEQGTIPDTRYQDGLLCHRVYDPIVAAERTAGDTLAFTVAPEEETARVTAALEEARLIGLPWSQEEIEAALRDFYADKGDQAKFKVSDIQDEKKTIKVLRQRIDFIRLPQVANEELFQVLQRTLSRKEFYEFARNEQAASGQKYLRRPAADDPEGSIAIGLKKAPEPDEQEDSKRLPVRDTLIHLNAFTAQRIGAALKDIDYIPVPSQPTDDADKLASFINLTMMKSEEAAKKPQHPSLHAFLDQTLYKVCPQNNNYFYGGLEYRPGQGIRGLGGYKCLKAGPGTAGFEAGADGAAIGNISYSGVVPFFGTGPGGAFHRPLFLQVEGSSLYERNRVFAGLMTNERRTGAMLRAVLPILTPAESTQFDLLAEAKRQTVALIRETKTVDKLNLTTLELGARFFLDKRSADRPSFLELTQRLKLGLGAAEQEPVFSVITLNGVFHREASQLFEFDVKGRVSLASDRTPVFELPVFGGVETVRGFREDDALGRRLWSVQPEVWLRARGLLAPDFDPATGGQTKLRQTLRDSLALAFFSDIGGVYRTFSSTAGKRYGPGLGIRFKYAKQATLRLDWAYGIGDGISGKGHGRFYFSFDLLENPF